MKFSIDYNKNDVDLKELEFTEEESGDLALAIENVGGAAISLMTMFAAMMTEDKAGQQALLRAVTDYIKDNAGKISQPEEAAPEFPFEEMESEFITWIYSMGYDDPYGFAEEYEGRDLQLDFAVEGDEVVVFFSAADGSRCETIGEISTYLFEDEEEMAAAKCIEYTCIAALAFDKIYGHENNPVRNSPVNKLEKEIREVI